MSRTRTPRDQVTAVMPDVASALPLVDTLKVQGFSGDGIAVIAGEEALAEVDPHGAGHGLLGRVLRTLEQFGQEGEEHREAAEEVRAGHALVVVDVADEAGKDRAAAAMREHGAHRLRYWGHWDVEDLDEP